MDGAEAPALGVMSQGELNAMTLSLFLPRVMLPQTPFGFVLVDDPCAGGLRRQRLLEGRTHDEVEQRLDDTGLAQLIAYTFFDDPERKGDVPARLRRLEVPAAAEIVMDCQSGSHEGFPGAAMELIRRTRKLCEELRRIGARPVPARR